MFAIEFVVTGADLPTVAVLTEALTELNVRYLERFGERTPPLYSAGVRYQLEPRGVEQFVLIPYVLARGYGDCAHLAAWRAAELRQSGFPSATAFPVRAPTMPDGTRVVHVLVSRDGSFDQIEDPSAVLGMAPLPRERLLDLARESWRWTRPVCSSWRR